MICQECNQRPATLHFTKIINGEKTEIIFVRDVLRKKVIYLWMIMEELVFPLIIY